MELKYKKSEQTTATYTSSNRTFMELKSDYLEVRMKAIFEF